jgi:hypothetical protein
MAKKLVHKRCGDCSSNLRGFTYVPYCSKAQRVILNEDVVASFCPLPRMRNLVVSETDNDALNAKLICPVLYDEVLLAGELVCKVHDTLVAELAKGGKRPIRFDTNFFHFIIYDVAEKCKDKKVHGLTRSWFRNGKYVPAVDSFLVLLGGTEEHQHQLHKECKEVMGEYLYETEAIEKCQA